MRMLALRWDRRLHMPFLLTKCDLRAMLEGCSASPWLIGSGRILIAVVLSRTAF